MANRTHNDLQNIAQKTKDRATRTPLKTGLHIIFLGEMNIITFYIITVNFNILYTCQY
jgi:hypothetical protein